MPLSYGLIDFDDALIGVIGLQNVEPFRSQSQGGLGGVDQPQIVDELARVGWGLRAALPIPLRQGFMRRRQTFP